MGDADLARIAELHGLWWDGVWSELAWHEHGNEPIEFALTIGELWDRFNRTAENAGFDSSALVAEFEAKGDPRATTSEDYAAMLGRMRCGS